QAVAVSVVMEDPVLDLPVRQHLLACGLDLGGILLGVLVPLVVLDQALPVGQILPVEKGDESLGRGVVLLLERSRGQQNSESEDQAHERFSFDWLLYAAHFASQAIASLMIHVRSALHQGKSTRRSRSSREALAIHA